MQEVGFSKFRERVCAFFLDFPPFGQSVLDGVRSKVVLRGEGYVWTPIGRDIFLLVLFFS